MPKAAPKSDADKAKALAAKQAKFKELAAKRLANALKQIQLIGNLSSYKPSDTQRDFIFKSLAEGAQAAMARFQPNAKADAPSIVIPD